MKKEDIKYLSKVMIWISLAHLGLLCGLLALFFEIYTARLHGGRENLKNISKMLGIKTEKINDNSIVERIKQQYRCQGIKATEDNM